MDFASLLNREQLQAVQHLQGPLLVIAGAGSGKTRVIEYRVLNLVLSGVKPQEILLLTFTRRASQEMLNRASKLDSRCEAVDGGTFHSFASRALRQYAKPLGIRKDFTILDSGDSEEALHKCATGLGYYESKDERFPQKATLQKVISQATNKKLRIAEVLELEYPNFIDQADKLEKLRLTYAEYKLNKSYLDYDDLLVFLRILLQEPGPRKELSARYRYVMVDEYQDTNFLQGEIVRLLGLETQNVMVVGDDAQSIYGFRGAHHENILKFPELFPGAKVIKLESNYRSTQEILDLGNGILEDMPHKFQKHLHSAENRRGQKPLLRFFKDTNEEARWVTEAILDLYHQGEPLQEIAVLFRSAYLSFQVQTELTKLRLPFQVFGGKKFSDTAHVKDLIAFLKVLFNFQDELAWNRILMLLPGVGGKTAAKVTLELIKQAGYPQMLEALRPLQKRKYGPELIQVVEGIAKVADPSLPIAQKFRVLKEIYLPYLKDQYDNWTQRLKDLESLEQIAARYHSLEQLLSDFALESPEREVAEVNGVDPDEGRISLSTIHSSKGLEWGHVFLIGMIEGLFPTSYSLRRIETIEEEERLFYVAVTRAKRQLVMTMCHYGFANGITQINKLSRFLDHPAVANLIERQEQAAPAFYEDYQGEASYNHQDLLGKIRNLWD